jgi:hypothetical protein
MRFRWHIGDTADILKAIELFEHNMGSEDECKSTILLPSLSVTARKPGYRTEIHHEKEGAGPEEA